MVVPNRGCRMERRAHAKMQCPPAVAAAAAAAARKRRQLRRWRRDGAAAASAPVAAWAVPYHQQETDAAFQRVAAPGRWLGRLAWR